MEQFPSEMAVDFDEQVKGLADLDLLKQIAEFYATNPELHQLAQNRASEMAGGVCWDLQEDFETHPAVPLLVKGLSKMYFCFTDPAEHESAVSDQSVIFLVAELCNQQGENPNMQALANQLDMRANNLMVCQRVLRKRGLLEGLTPDQQFEVVANNLDAVLLGVLPTEEG